MKGQEVDDNFGRCTTEYEFVYELAVNEIRRCVLNAGHEVTTHQVESRRGVNLSIGETVFPASQ